MTHNHSNSSNKIGWAFLLNFSFTIIEFIGGWLTNSTAIMADAVHDLGDSISIGSAWFLNKLGEREADENFTYGYKRLSLLGAFINGAVLILGSIWVLSEAIPRVLDPVVPKTEGMILLAILGVAVNGFAVYKLQGGNTLNEKVLNWHLLEDVLGWFAVLIIAIVMQFFDWPILDPLLSISFTLFILINVFRNLLATLKLFLQGVPEKNLYKQVLDELWSVDRVENIHDLKIWSLDGEHNVITIHVSSALKTVEEYKLLKLDIYDSLAMFEFSYSTVEIEFIDGHSTINEKVT